MRMHDSDVAVFGKPATASTVARRHRLCDTSIRINSNQGFVETSSTFPITSQFGPADPDLGNWFRRALDATEGIRCEASSPASSIDLERDDSQLHRVGEVPRRNDGYALVEFLGDARDGMAHSLSYLRFPL